MKKESTLGLYLHIPFCVAKCRYCDFYSRPGMDDGTKAAYADALMREIRAAAPADRGRKVDTVFFGGGTPTCLDTQDLCAIAQEIRACYDLSADAEFTCEVNPATADEGKLTAMRQAGFNRISLGMQSAHENELSYLGRVHRPGDLYAAVAAARAAGFCNISLDLMFGIPAQTKDSFAATLDTAIGLAPDHLSVYSLQLEEGTPFYRERHSLPLPSEEEESEMAACLYQKTAEAGYLRYEISNFAKPGYESRHNLRYWQMKDYRGFGPAAHSLIGEERFYNRTSLTDYLRDPCGLREEEESVSPREREYETVMLGLRLSSGIAEDDFKDAFGRGFYASYREKIDRLAAHDLVHYDGTRTRLTERGMALSNAVLSEILEDF